jgi:entericidin B
MAAEKRAGTLAPLSVSSYNRRFEMISKFIAPLVAALFFAGLFGTLAGCNTIEGAGTDIQQGGKAIKDEAREQKNKM